MPNPQNIVKHKFEKGKTGNPKGRPKRLPDLDVLGAEIFGADPETGASKMQEMIEAMYKKAIKGDTRAAAYLMDRFYGKPMQRSELTGKDGETLAGTFVIEVPKID